MIVKEEGYVYDLQTAEGHPAVTIAFCRKDEGRFVDGITNEELIELLVSRLTYLVKQKPTEFNMNALTHAQQAKQWIHTRSYQKNLKKKRNIFPDARRRNDIQIPVKGGQAGFQERG